MSKGSLTRLANVWKASVNEVLDRLEQPEKMVRQYGRDLETAVEASATALAQATVSLRRTERRLALAGADVGRLERQAEDAMLAGDEAGARSILARKAGVDASMSSLELAVEEGRTAVEGLRVELDTLRGRLQEIRNREGALVARYQATRSHRGVETGSVAGQLGQGEEAVRQWERANDKIEAAEVEAEIYRQMAPPAKATAPDVGKIEDELEALRSKVSSGKANSSKVNSGESVAT
jgi:phage shock protein A